jgi:hypothetical protein
MALLDAMQAEGNVIHHVAQAAGTVR